ncbi:hypothetical protein [Devosia sp. 2618]|uniref:hypothetical protein n=1 Tax=Devosia sp. 2618 TaxID=3156454 RepID=UPI00339A08A1
MANPQKGEVIVQIDAGEFVLCYPLGAVAAIEGQFPGRTIEAVLADLNEDKPKTQTLMVVIWAGLKKHHQLSLDEVGDLITLAEMSTWAAKVAQAFKLAQPEAKAKGPPRKAAAS